ncbi:MAG: M3 family metallopeptidase [Porphyromonas sp.]|nr:M3 family metallopeptidase [Porphyromonas sp.]
MSKENVIFPDFSNSNAEVLSQRIYDEIKAYRAEIEQIRATPAEETNFSNTILALENAGKGLDLASATFFNLLSCNADDELMAHSEQVTSELTDLENEVGFDPVLAQKVRAIYEKESDALSAIDQRLKLRTFQGYKRRGAYLSEGKQEELKELRKELSLSTLQFGQNLLKEQGEYTLSVMDKSCVSRLPQTALETAKQKAEERQVSGYIFDFTAPSYNALMKYCDSRAVRERIYRDRGSLCYDDTKETYNATLVYKIVELRHRIAKLLGYNSYADYVLEAKMAKAPDKVFDMLDQLRDAYLPLAHKEMEQIETIAKEMHQIDELMPWDFSYYAEHYRQQKLQYDEEETRPYFELNSVVTAMLSLASDLYEIEFEVTDQYIPYHPEVKTYQVSAKGAHIGLLMMDFFPRKEKRSGAWMTNYVEAYSEVRPVVSLVMNFTPPTKSTPSLLSIDEVRTLFHEFGHGLHGLLTQVPYASLSGTNVEHDFVELPSHFHENWVKQPEFLRRFVRHYQTGEVISDELLDAIRRNERFLEGYSCIRQLNFGYLDMKWHSGAPEKLSQEIEEVESEVQEPIRLLPHVEGTCISTAFSHLFSGGYAAGYYGYKWSEILEADAFEEFLKHGLYDHSTSMRFKKEILERGDAEEPEVLYRNFKGRDATIEALERRSGLIE